MIYRITGKCLHRYTQYGNLARMSKIFTADLTDSGHEPPPAPGALDLIDRAIASAKSAAHACRDEAAREHFEYALALLSEAWIAESGQQARVPARLIADVKSALALFAAIAARPLQPSSFNPHPSTF
jgi:hypothetical protein